MLELEVTEERRNSALSPVSSLIWVGISNWEKWMLFEHSHLSICSLGRRGACLLPAEPWEISSIGLWGQKGRYITQSETFFQKFQSFFIFKKISWKWLMDAWNLPNLPLNQGISGLFKLFCFIFLVEKKITTMSVTFFPAHSWSWLHYFSWKLKTFSVRQSCHKLQL